MSPLDDQVPISGRRNGKAARNRRPKLHANLDRPLNGQPPDLSVCRYQMCHCRYLKRISTPSSRQTGATAGLSALPTRPRLGWGGSVLNSGPRGRKGEDRHPNGRRLQAPVGSPTRTVPRARGRLQILATNLNRQTGPEARPAQRKTRRTATLPSFRSRFARWSEVAPRHNRITPSTPSSKAPKSPETSELQTDKTAYPWGRGPRAGTAQQLEDTRQSDVEGP